MVRFAAWHICCDSSTCSLLRALPTGARHQLDTIGADPRQCSTPEFQTHKEIRRGDSGHAAKLSKLIIVVPEGSWAFISSCY
jgi:hypothetical protein